MKSDRLRLNAEEMTEEPWILHSHSVRYADIAFYFSCFVNDFERWYFLVPIAFDVPFIFTLFEDYSEVFNDVNIALVVSASEVELIAWKDPVKRLAPFPK
jgi:hypothetical protein